MLLRCSKSSAAARGVASTKIPKDVRCLLLPAGPCGVMLPSLLHAWSLRQAQRLAAAPFPGGHSQVCHSCTSCLQEGGSDTGKPQSSGHGHGGFGDEDTVVSCSLCAMAQSRLSMCSCAGCKRQNLTSLYIYIYIKTWPFEGQFLYPKLYTYFLDVSTGAHHCKLLAELLGRSRLLLYWGGVPTVRQPPWPGPNNSPLETPLPLEHACSN